MIMKKIILIFSTFLTLQIMPEHKILTLFAHGIVDGPAQADRFRMAFPHEKSQNITFCDTLPETGYNLNQIISYISSLYKKPVNRSNMYMGQTKDIEAIHLSMKKQPHSQNIILFGCSRGSATILNYMGKYNPENISALILDACPANMPQTIRPILAKYGIQNSWDIPIFRKLFPKYPKNAISPLEAIKSIQNKNLPILLIHSEKDATVPFAHTLMLYQEFQKHNFNHVYLAKITDGKHSYILQDPKAKTQYLQAVHSFYKNFNLPFNHTYATQDINLFVYDLNFISAEIEKYHKKLESTYLHAQKHNAFKLNWILPYIIKT